MAKDETSPGGLLSKMVKFVRSPGTQWNDLDNPNSSRDGALSKQALKEMIERKKRNDFVRKREFDMLRKLRRREATGGSPSEAEARPSFFQSSMPSRPDDRAMTLKKIDEIEAQMSMQWWKTKHGTSGAPSLINPSSGFANSNAAAPAGSPNPGQPAAQAGSMAYARTEADDLQNSIARRVGMLPAQGVVPKLEQVAAVASRSVAPASAASVSTQSSAANSPQRPASSVAQASGALPIASARASTNAPFGAASPARTSATMDQSNSLDFTAEFSPALKPVIKASPFSAVRAPAAAAKSNNGLGGLAASYEASGTTTGFSASKLFAIVVDEVQHDPELEEAAIRFANGDDGGAETGLLDAVSARGSRHQHEETWLTLFDLYRATGQYDRFESLAIDFASKFGRSSPAWFSIPDMVSQITGAEAKAPTGMRKADWKCPAVLGIQSVAALKAALVQSSMPWTLEWAAIQSIDDSAVAPLTTLLLSWASEPVQLRMAHSQQLEKILRDGAPSGVSTTEPARWNLLLAYLRVAHRPDEFEMAALDFCVTYEVSPPSWESARCEFKLLDADGNTGLGQTIVGEAVRDSVQSELQTETGSSTVMAQLLSVELSGQIMGEPGPVLDKLEARLAGADMMIISCAKLVRVDFSAAGSLLNWVTARQSEGRLVQFTDVHRLVAAFFHVIGISEYAKVLTRLD